MLGIIREYGTLQVENTAFLWLTYLVQGVQYYKQNIMQEPITYKPKVQKLGGRASIYFYYDPSNTSGIKIFKKHTKLQNLNKIENMLQPQNKQTNYKLSKQKKNPTNMTKSQLQFKNTNIPI